MAASNTPTFDLIELSWINSNILFTRAPGGGGDILGVVDNATYTDNDGSNTLSNVAELNEGGVIRIDGQDYTFDLVVPDGIGNGVTIYHDGGSTVLNGDGGSSEIVFIMAYSLSGGGNRYFALVDDSIGDLANITAIQTQWLDWDPAGNDVKIDLSQDNTITICFAAGTRIATPAGPRAVEDLRVGDRVTTLDAGPVALTWRSDRRYDLTDPDLARRRSPVRIAPDALAQGVPHRPLLVSPQHRLLIASPVAERMFGAPEVLIPATKLVGYPGITRPGDLSEVRYCHFHLGAHHIVLAEGAPTESLLRAEMSLRSLTVLERMRLLRRGGGLDKPARPIVDRAGQVQDLLRRHLRNGKPLVSIQFEGRTEGWADPSVPAAP